MTHDFRHFPSIINMNDLAAARYIDTAVGKLEDFRPVMQHIAKFGDRERNMRILDFGCGLGRNLVGMMEYSDKWIAWGYDHPTMLERAKKFYGERLTGNDRLFLIDSWDAIKEQAMRDKKRKFFDLIFACLVFQHIKLNELRYYLADMAQMTHRLYVAGRRGNDYEWGKLDNWKIVAEFFDPIELEDGLLESSEPNDHHYGIYRPKRNL